MANIIPCNEIEQEADRLRDLFTSCYKLKAADMDALADLAYSASLCGTGGGGGTINQNNIFVVSDFSVRNPNSNPATAINLEPSFVVGEREIRVFRHTTNKNVGLKGQLETRYYILKSGKGTYGVGGTQITSDNLLLMKEDLFTLPADPDSTLAPNVVSLFAINIPGSSISNPHLMLNGTSPAISIVDGQDTYFIMKENPVLASTWNLYRFTGAAGIYGQGGNSTATLGDFLLVETFIEGRLPPIVNKIEVREIGVGELIGNVANDDVGKAIQRNFDENVTGLLPISVGEHELVYFVIQRINKGKQLSDVDTALTLELTQEKWLWKRGAANDMTNTCVASDFMLVETNKAGSVVLPPTSGRQNPTVIFNLYGNLDTPHTILNARTNPLVVDDNDVYVKVSPGKKAKTEETAEYKLYRFLRGDGSYGSGQTQTVLGDFELVEHYSNDVVVVIPGGKISKSIGTRTLRITDQIDATVPARNSISKVVALSTRPSIKIYDNELYIFLVERVVRDGNIFRTYDEKWLWTKGEIEDVLSLTLIDSFFLNIESVLINEFVTGGPKPEPPVIVPVLVDDVDTTTQVVIGMNTADVPIVVDDAQYDIFISANPLYETDTKTKLYKFNGPDGTYGDGQVDTALAADLAEIVKLEPEDSYITKTSQLTNDGDGVNPFATTDQIGTSATGFEAIDSGFRLIGKNPANFGPTGARSVDAGHSNTASALIGVTGSDSFNYGVENENAGIEGSLTGGYQNKMIGAGVHYANTMFGDRNTMQAPGSYTSANIISGYGNIIQGNSTYGALFGKDNKINTTHAAIFTGASFSTGINNINRGKGTSLLGLGLDGGTTGTTIVGQANQEFGTLSTGFTATTNVATNPVFVVGNGTVDINTFAPTVKSNAMFILKNGSVNFPSLTTALIDAADGKSATTKEWVQANLGTAPTGLEALDEGNGIGHRIIGRDLAKFGNIGLSAIDLGNSTINGTFGASGDYATISGGLNHEIEQTANWATIGGGNYHSIRNTSDFATISGGNNNTIINNSIYSTISGGRGGSIDGTYATLAGGDANSITSSTGGTISGGLINNANGWYATISGGFNNTTSSFGEWVGGIYGTVSAGSATTIVGTDRLFNVGNGTAVGLKSDAFTILKNGLATLPSVTNTLINDEPTGKAILTKEWFQANSPISIKVTLTPAQIKTLNSVPVQIIPSPGAGKYIRIHESDAFLTWNSVAYNNFATSLYTVGSGLNQLIFGDFLNKTEDWNISGAIQAGSQKYVTNTAVNMTADSDSAVGDSNVTFYITYSIITL